ncbi:hypothetical protein PQQ84_00210 [Paraburkholderia strydomiana]|uniref:hypothetical protein n=1 Tax=Paraburkholderia strydomiana TaxID=1245417 RepID=UPI0038BC0040
MPSLLKSFKLSGMVGAFDLFHSLDHNEDVELLALAPKPTAPIYVTIPNGRRVPQYAPTARTSVSGFNPSLDCDGNFASSKFQPNNNCYNYACNIATSSFAQPGRLHGQLLDGPPDGETVANGAVLDGLVRLDAANVTMAQLRSAIPDATRGHFVALLISQPDHVLGWPGDYHWVRSDDRQTNSSWSQKDGGDQVTNFDFAGAPIPDPREANWIVNQGPIISGNPNDIYVSYEFFCFMFVPDDSTDII